MDIVHERAAGMDISKRDAKLCLRVPGQRPGTFTSTVTTWGATTGQILELRDVLEREHVTTVVSDLTGVSSRAMLEALIDGERDPEVLAGLAKGTLRSKIPALVDALTGRFKAHHAFMARLHLDQIDAQSSIIDALTGRIEEAMTPFRAAREFPATIPGVSLKVADVIIAETGADMSRFETPGRLASWAGVCPGSNESAGRIKSAHILPGNKYLKAALGTAALSASRSKDTYLAAKYRRITARRGPMKAIVALEHSILTAAWHLLADGECYADPGADHFTRPDPIKAKNNAIKKLNSLGFDVTITPAPAA